MKRLLRTLAGLALATALGGCSLGYYAQSVGGHLDLMQRARDALDAGHFSAFAAEVRRDRAAGPP